MEPRRVLEAVAAEFGITVDELVGRRRTARVALARHTAALLLREQLGLQVTEVGRVLGGRHHATASNSIERAYSRRLDRPTYRARLEDLADRLHRSPAA